MQLEVLLFGPAADRAKSDRATVTVNDRPTVRDVLVALAEQHAALRFALPDRDTGRLAVNQALVGGEHAVRPGDELALVTLVGGG